MLQRVLTGQVALGGTSHHPEVPRPLVPPLACGDRGVIGRLVLQPTPVCDLVRVGVRVRVRVGVGVGVG